MAAIIKLGKTKEQLDKEKQMATTEKRLKFIELNKKLKEKHINCSNFVILK